MNYRTEEYNSALIAHLEGILDAEGVVAMVEQIKMKAPSSPPRVVLNFSEVDALDPMGLVEILQLSTWMKDENGRLRVYGAAKHVETAFRDNMISDVDFFPDLDSATVYVVKPDPEPIEDKEPEPVVQKTKPKKDKPKKSVLPLVISIIGISLLGIVGVAIKWLLTPKDPVFELVGVTEGEDIKITPGESKGFQVKVSNAEQIVSPPNPDWVEVRVNQIDSKNWEIEYELSPPIEYSETAKLYFYASKGSKRYASPEIYIHADVKPTPPKFLTTKHEQITHSSGQTGYLLDPGVVGERYGPDGVSATGGANIRYTSTGHESWGLRFDKKTGRFSGTPTKPTDTNDYAVIKVKADNGQGVPAELTLLLKIEDIPQGDPDFAFAEEIDKRFANIDLKELPAKNIGLLFTYKDTIRKSGSNGLHKVSTIYFGLGEKSLSYENKRKLDEEFQDSRFKTLAEKSDSYFFVLGYADKGKTADSINKAIINSRANVLRDYLVKHLKEDLGFSEKQIEESVKTIPMLPLSGEGEGKIFESAERSRAGEIWVVGDPR